MTHDEASAAALTGGVSLLERALAYALGALRAVTPESLTAPTPCAGWDLDDLLSHMDDSVKALAEAVEAGHVVVESPTDAPCPVDVLRSRACGLLGAWTSGSVPEMVDVGGSPVSSSVIAGAGAIEITVHGWDVARACGHRHHIPESLAEELLPLAGVMVSDADRPGRFAAPVHVPVSVPPSERLLAYLGRVS